MQASERCGGGKGSGVVAEMIVFVPMSPNGWEKKLTACGAIHKNASHFMSHIDLCKAARADRSIT